MRTTNNKTPEPFLNFLIIALAILLLIIIITVQYNTTTSL